MLIAPLFKNCQKVEKTPSVHTKCGACRKLYSLKKEWNSDTCYNEDKPWKHHAKWNESDTQGQILYDSTYMTHLNRQIHKDEI